MFFFLYPFCLLVPDKFGKKYDEQMDSFLGKLYIVRKVIFLA